MDGDAQVRAMEFSGGIVARETQYFADPFEPPRSRAALAEPMPDRSGAGRDQVGD